MGLARPRFEFGVKLRGDEERVIGEFDDLDEAVVRGNSANPKTSIDEFAAIGIVELVAVTVALVDQGFTVKL